MEDKIIIEINNNEKIIAEKGTTIEDILKENAITNVVAALADNELVSLDKVLECDTKLKLILNTDKVGTYICLNGLKFIYIVAVKEVLGKEVNVELKHSIDKGIYTTIDYPLNEEILDKIKNKMDEIIENNYKIEKITTTRKDAIDYFTKLKEFEKVDNYMRKTTEIITLYSLLDYYNYFYTIMPVSTGYIKDYKLTLIENNAVILIPPQHSTGEVADYNHMDEVIRVFNEYESWASKLNMNYVSDVNTAVINGRIEEFIELNEIRFNEQINTVANKIADNLEDIKLVCIAGPSSSGKTTTSKKLALFLKSKGVNPFIISMDNYFRNKVDTPRNEKGEYLYDIVEAIDGKQLNEDLNKLLNGEEIRLPIYNFITGEREYKLPPVSLKSRDVLIIEGIHALNDELTKCIERKNKYKIYVSPFTPLRLDRYNHVSTIDLRFIRRLVRDNRTRGNDAYTSFKNWPLVRDSEEKYIFPYQNQADTILNTALIYELGMLKTYAIPLLQSIKMDSEYYKESVRIINFLKNFLNIPIDSLPATSVLREFVGNGYFE